ncbi:MAG: 1-phosphofructokinase family hexose kinase [Myxococcota bacterium]
MSLGPIVTVTLNPALDESSTVPRIRPDVKLRCSAPTREPGGGGVNVARVAHRFGVDERALWACGGPEGNRIAALLDAEGVTHVPVPVSGDTRRNLHVTETETDKVFRFNLPGGVVTEADLDALLARLASEEGAAFVVASGSVPPGLGADAWTRVVAAAPRGARVILDTSGDALRHALGHGLFLIKPNRNELAKLVGRPLPDREAVAEAARTLVADGAAEGVVVSLGAEGLLLVTATEEVFVAAPRVHAVSAVGAGDSTVAGIVVALVRGLSLAEAVRFGAAAGAAAVLTPGTALCSPEDVERIYAGLAQG